MANRITGVDRHSPARRAGVRTGESLLAVNGHPILDVLDYKYYTYDALLSLTLRTKDGRERTVRVRKEEGEDPGLEFDRYLMDSARTCANRCLFCFVDQMPPGMRESLYFKDDDARLSFLQGNYITMTNLSERELQRICDLRVSPINISVHATQPELREKMLGHRNAGACLAIMERLAGAGITMNCQIVCCPDINDGAHLRRTLEDLAKLYPAVRSVSVVPVGLTRYREGLYPLRGFTGAESAALLDQVEGFARDHREKTGTRLVWCSDEFYLSAGRSLPAHEEYEEYFQLENGVGMLRLLEREASLALEGLEPGTPAPSPFAIATGTAAAPFLEELTRRAAGRCPGLCGSVHAIENRFFGESITVSGLVTGGDLIGQLRGRDLGERLLIPANMLRAGEEVFLDDVTLSQASGALGVPVIPVEQDGGALIDAMLGLSPPPAAGAERPEGDAEYFRYR